MDLSLPLTKVSGIGPKTAEFFAAASITTLRDLLYHLPRTYENYQDVSHISDLTPGKVVLRATIENIKTTRKRRNLSLTEATLRDNTGAVRTLWFNQPYRAKQFEQGKEYYFSGDFGLSHGRYQLTNPSATAVSDYDTTTAKHQPVYPAKGDLTSKKLTQIFKKLKPTFATIPELLPPSPRTLGENLPSSFSENFPPAKTATCAPDGTDRFVSPSFGVGAQKEEPETVLPAAQRMRSSAEAGSEEKDIRRFSATKAPKLSRAEALFKAHFPESEKDVKEARTYLAHEELFELILASTLNRQKNTELPAPKIPQNLTTLKKAISSLPFTLTGAQRRALWEIIQDLELPTPMNRLLQGDVGSGKTIVAGLSALCAATARHQTALLAPTEILATQHAETLHRLLAPLGVTTALLTGSTKNKKQLKSHIASGEVDLIIGTHAILTDDTQFHSLALAIIDEQHRFGVAQRQKLLAKSPIMPHLLSMTATPIPRSLQLTIFGDLSVSILNELPKGRQPITTKIISPNSTTQMWQAINREIEDHHQAFYICKTIEESQTSELSNVKKETEKLRATLPTATIEYLHGKMKPAEKDAIMSEFSQGTIDILVSTTVVEVGVDVPNATTIIIADADRYGLAQLHQLRGRVGRGQHPSFCYLVNSTSDRPTRRLREIENSTDGFYLAEVDLKLRGPGAIYGTLQHGVLDLRIATITDTTAIHRAQKAVNTFLQSNPNMLDYQELSSDIKKYQKITTLN